MNFLQSFNWEVVRELSDVFFQEDFGVNWVVINEEFALSDYQELLRFEKTWFADIFQVVVVSVYVNGGFAGVNFSLYENLHQMVSNFLAVIYLKRDLKDIFRVNLQIEESISVWYFVQVNRRIRSILKLSYPEIWK